MLYDAQREIHRHGVSGAKARARSKFERRCIDAAAAMLAREGERTIAYGSQAGTVLPRRQTASLSTTIQSQATALTYRLRSPAGIALPFGSAARMIFVQLLTLSIETGSRTFPFPQSLHAWGNVIGASMGGRSYTNVALQSHLIGNARLFVGPSERIGEGDEFAFVEALDFERVGAQSPAALTGSDYHDLGYPISTTVTDGLFDHAVRHAYAVDGGALRLIQTSSWAIDLYLWLSGLLPKLEEPALWTWQMLAHEFGSAYKHPLRAKAHLLAAATLTQAVYPGARIALSDEGLVMHPSRPPLG